MTSKGRGEFVFAKGHSRGHLEDKISQLPDVLLVSILSHVTLREAARTSVLSSRWDKVWTFIPTLNFDASLTLQFVRVQQNQKLHIMIERPKFVNWVNSVLESYQGPTVDEFSVRFDLNKDFEHDIDRWLNFALEKKVRRLMMDFRDCGGHSQNYYELYHFPLLCNTVRRLHTRLLGFPSCSSLRVLLLRDVDITGEAVEYFLSSCPFLEQLCVRGSNSIVDLKVPGPLLCLKYLELTSCFEIESIDISATNLLSFKYLGDRFIMPYEKFPNLVELDIQGGHSDYLIDNPSLLSSYAFRLEILVLTVRNIKENMALIRFPLLTRLRKLELAVRATYADILLVLGSLLKVSPVLCTLKMKIFYFEPWCGRMQYKPPNCPHQCLKEVEIVGFVGCTIGNALARYLIENAVMLEKIIIDSRSPHRIGTPWEYLDENHKAKKHAERLRSKYSLGDKLLVR